MTETEEQIAERARLEKIHGHVWNTTEVTRDFAISGFLAPYVIATRKSDNATGHLTFQHSPRFYFSFAVTK
jgi:hypothetical protein